jgi:exosortase
MEVKDPAPQNNTSFYFVHYIPLLVVGIFVVFFFNTFQELYARWIKWDEALSHGLLVVGVFLFLLFKSLPWRAQNQSTPLFFSICAMVAFLSLGWFLFNALNIFILEQLILLPLFALALAAIFGFQTAFQHRLLLLLPIFAIPIWDQLTNILVNLSASVVGEMVRLVKMPAIIDGNSIYIPYGHILIADGCSGLRYLVISLAIGYIIGCLNRYDEKRMLVVLAVAATIGLMANWIRIFILILVGYQTKMQSSLMSDHEYFGWLLFGLLCLPAIYFAPVVKAKPETHEQNPSEKTKLVFPLIALSVGPLAALMINVQPQVNPWSDHIPNNLQPSSPNSMPIPLRLPENGYNENAYALVATDRAYIQLSQYQRHADSDKLVPYMTHLYDTEAWSPADKITVNNLPFQIIVLREKGGLRRVAQAQWFITGDHQTATIREAKLMQIPALLTGKNRFVVVTIQSECGSTNCDNAITAVQHTARNLLDKEI